MGRTVKQVGICVEDRYGQHCETGVLRTELLYI